MPKVDTNLSTFLIALAIAGGVLMSSVDAPKSDRGLGLAGYFGASAEAQGTDAAKKRPRWAASATGRVEPASGAVEVSALGRGRIEEIYVETGDVVQKGDLLARLEDEEPKQRVLAARAEADVRKFERDDEQATGLALDRRNAEDKVEELARSLFKARRDFEDVLALQESGEARESDVNAARDTVSKLEKDLKEKRAELRKLNADPAMPLPDRLDSSLTIARTDLAMAREQFEKTRVLAPFDGTVLNVNAHEGETAGTGAPGAMFVFGDVSKLRVRAEVEERDIAKVRVGQKAVVRADAFPDRDFEGTVTEVSGALGSPQIATRGPRRPNDVDVLEVVVDLEGSPPLITGMRVDVFFHQEEADAKKSASASASLSE